MTDFDRLDNISAKTTAIVTGATSFVGLELVRQLLGAGEEVCAVMRPDSPNAAALGVAEGLRIVELDLSQMDRLLGLVPSANAFYHLGWEGGGVQNRAREDVQTANIAYTESAARAAVELGCKAFVFTGSQAEYGPRTVPLDEDAKLLPVTPYGRAKIEAARRASEICSDAGVHFAHGRIFSAYGPGDHPWTLVSQCVEGFLDGRDVALSTCEQLWNYLHVSDTAAALRAILGRDGAFNIASPETKPLKESVETIHRLCGGRGRPLYAAREPGVEPPYGIAPVVSRLLGTGWQPQISFEQGIRLMIEERT